MSMFLPRRLLGKLEGLSYFNNQTVVFEFGNDIQWSHRP